MGGAGGWGRRGWEEQRAPRGGHRGAGQLSCTRAAHARGNPRQECAAPPCPHPGSRAAPELHSSLHASWRLVSTRPHVARKRRPRPGAQGRALALAGPRPHQRVSSSRARIGAEQSVGTGQGRWPGEGTRDRNTGQRLPPQGTALGAVRAAPGPGCVHGRHPSGLVCFRLPGWLMRTVCGERCARWWELQAAVSQSKEGGGRVGLRFGVTPPDGQWLVATSCGFVQLAGPWPPAVLSPSLANHSRGRCSYTSLKTFMKALTLVTFLKSVSRKQVLVCFLKNTF